MKSFKPLNHSSDAATQSPFRPRWPGWRVALKTYQVRDYWWFVLDAVEHRTLLRRSLYAALFLLVGAGAFGWWAYPHWNEYRTIRLARQWLASGHYQYAADAAREAMIAAPKNPEPWQIAAKLASLGNQRDKALDYARRAAELAPAEPGVVVGWAVYALQADQLAEAERALDQLPPETQAQLGQVQRIRGELARRRQQLGAARRHFESALQLEGPLATNEVPLGLVLLQSTDEALRQRGLALLGHWTNDAEWGAAALRTLLTDARARGDRADLYRHAEALRTHPGCTVSDMPDCLLALAQTNPTHFSEVLATLEKNHAVSPQAAGQLLSWLNQIGRGREAVAWMKTLPADALRRPPLVVAAAEALRLAEQWDELFAWTHDFVWGQDVEFLRWAYGLHAAQKRGDTTGAAALRSTLYSYAAHNDIHAQFAASLLYSWGCEPEAEALWWRAADQAGASSLDALGALARYYQVKRDAEGQYRTFRQLQLRQAHDAAIGNNFAFFAALVGREQRSAEQLSRANLEREPGNAGYAATRAFVLFTQNRAQEGLTLLQPFVKEAERSPGVAFAYGLTLAALHRPDEARPWLDRLPPESLTTREVELIKTTLGR